MSFKLSSRNADRILRCCRWDKCIQTRAVTYRQQVPRMATIRNQLRILRLHASLFAGFVTHLPHQMRACPRVRPTCAPQRTCTRQASGQSFGVAICGARLVAPLNLFQPLPGPFCAIGADRSRSSPHFQGTELVRTRHCTALLTISCCPLIKAPATCNLFISGTSTCFRILSSVHTLYYCNNTA